MNAGPGPIQEGGKILLPVAVVVSIVTAAWIVRGGMSDLEVQGRVHSTLLNRLQEDVNGLRLQLVEATASRWHRSDMARWTDTLQALNEGLRVPKVEDQ